MNKCTIAGTWRETHFRQWLGKNPTKLRRHYVVEFGLSDELKDQLLTLEIQWFNSNTHPSVMEDSALKVVLD